LAAVDAKGAFDRVAGTFREHHYVGDQLRTRPRQHIGDDVPRTSTVVVLLGHRCVGTHGASVQRPVVDEFEQDLGGDDLRHDAGQLIGRTTTEHEVLPLRLRRKVTQLIAQGDRVHRGPSDQTPIGIDGAPELVAPLIT
jgi:hypothetical protein